MNPDQQAKQDKQAAQQKMQKPGASVECKAPEQGEQNELGGKQIQDFYITKQGLGKGAFGSVFIAYKLTKEGKKNGKFAAKVIQLTTLNDKEIIQLTREIEILKTIRHDNIVKMEHVTRTKNNLYLFLEYIKDGDLSKYLENKRRLSQEETIFFFRQIVNGFKELYKRNIIHRDIKPENILLEKKENHKRLLISDFGFARVVNQDQMNKQIEQTPVGSLKYMAPQILGIINFSCKCDVWSLGVMIYELLYGYPPWMDDTYQRLLNRILSQPLTFPENVQIIPELKELLRKMMTIDEEQRISWDEIFLHPLLNEEYEFYTKFKQTESYIQSSMKEIYIEADLKLALQASLAQNQNNDSLQDLKKQVCEYLSYQRKLMVFLTYLINEIIKFQTFSSFEVSKVLYHKTLLLLQKQQQIIREEVQAILNAEQIASDAEYLQQSQLEKLKDSECFKYFIQLKQRDDDNVMPFFIQMFTNSAKYLDTHQEEDFVKILKQKLKLKDEIFTQNHESILSQFIVGVMTSINKKQNKYHEIIQCLICCINCREYQKQLLWDQNGKNQNQQLYSKLKAIKTSDLKILEQQANEYFHQLQPYENSPLRDSSESQGISQDKIMMSQEHKNMSMLNSNNGKYDQKK
ncbi:hypothetical protein ABPG74_017041 [Tetrahymena malaccensis]